MRTDDRCSFSKRSGRDYGYVMSDGSIYTTKRCTSAPTYVCTLGNNGQIYNKAGQQIGQIDSKGQIYKGPKGSMKAVGEVSSHRCYKNGAVVGFMDDGTGYTSDTDGLFRLRFTTSVPYGEYHFVIMLFLYSLFI